MALQRTATGELLLVPSGELANECCCGPSDDCDWSVSPLELTFDCSPQAGAVNINVLTGSGCGWEASVTSGGAYLSLNSASSGNNSSSIGFDLQGNDGSERTGSITVVTTVVSPLGPIGTVIGVFELTQSACSGNPPVGGIPPPSNDACRWSISPGSATFDCAIQNGFFNVHTFLGCGWAASVISGGSFITIFSGSSGNDAGTVQFSVGGNSGAARGGQIEIITTVISDFGPAGTVIGVFNIAQIAQSACGSGGSGALPCNWEVNPEAVSTPHPCAVTLQSDVITGIGCAWNASVTLGGAFINITSGSSGLSSGTIVYDIAENGTAADRAGQITVVTAAASVYGPIGTPVGYINIFQGISTSYTVSGGPIVTMDQGFGCVGRGVGSPAPIWDGVVTFFACGPVRWTSTLWASWEGRSIGSVNGLTQLQKDSPVVGSWGLSITNGVGDSLSYVKVGGDTPVGTYNVVGGCGDPLTLTVS